MAGGLEIGTIQGRTCIEDLALIIALFGSDTVPIIPQSADQLMLTISQVSLQASKPEVVCVCVFSLLELMLLHRMFSLESTLCASYLSTKRKLLTS